MSRTINTATVNNDPTGHHDGNNTTDTPRYGHTTTPEGSNCISGVTSAVLSYYTIKRDIYRVP